MNRRANLFFVVGSLVLVLLIFLYGRQTGNPPHTSGGQQTKEWFGGYPLYEVYTRSFGPEGTFKALEERLPDLKARGINNLWLMPIHPVGELGRKGAAGCPYSVRDYLAVGSEYGTTQDFADLIEAAHELDMRVILDMVINHCANDHVEMAAHPDWYFHDSTGAFSREVADWSDVTDWNFDSPAAREYLDSVLIYWVKKYDVDGYRCDVAGMVPDDFWQQIIPELRSLKPDIFMLAEWEAPQMHLDGFDATYDWTLYHRMVMHREGEISLDSLWQAVEWRQETYPESAFALRFIENHDQERAYTVFGDHSRSYAALVFTLPGIPLFYNGQEIGAQHRPSLFEKEPIQWAEARPDVEHFYDELLRMRDQLPVLRRGSIRRIAVNPQDQVLAFERASADQSALVFINFSDQEITIDSPEGLLKGYHLWDKSTLSVSVVELGALDYVVFIKD